MAGEYAKKFLEERAREKGVSPSVYEKKSAKTTESYAERFLREREENKAKSLLGRLSSTEMPMTAQQRAVENIRSGAGRLGDWAAGALDHLRGTSSAREDLERSLASVDRMLEPLRTEKANWDAQKLLKEIGALDKEIATSQSRADHLYGTLRKPQSIKMPDYGAIGEELDAQARLEALGIGLKERQDAYAAHQEQYAPEMDMYGPYLDASGQLVQHGAAQKYQEMMDAQQAYDDALALYQDKVKAADQAREDENKRQSVARIGEIYNNQKNQADQAQQLADQLTAERDAALREYYRALETGDLVKKNQENPYTRTSDDTRIAAAIGTGQAGTYTREMQIMDQMTDAELAVMTYLRNTQGEDAASAYFDYKRSELEKRRVGQGAQIMYKYGSEQPAGASLVSVWQNLGGAALSPAKIAEDLLTGQEIGSANDEFEFGTYRDAAREGVMKDMGGAGRFLYQTGMSMLDSAASAALLGKTGGALALGTGAGTDAIRSAKESGASDGQALTLGLVAGAAELVTEKMGFDRLAGMFGGSRGGIVRSIAKNMVSEFGEESATEVANLLADVFVMGDKSQFNQLLSANMEAGLPPTEAAWKAVVTLAGQVGLAGLGGAISGGVMGGGAVSLGKFAQYIDEKASQTATEKAAPLPSAKAETTVEQLAQETADAEMELEKAAQEPMRVAMDPQVQSALTAAAQQYGEDAGAFTANYEQGDAAAYNRAFDTVYRAGQSGLPLESVKQAGSELIRGMSDGAVKRIYQAGQQQAAKTITPGVKKMYSQKLSGEQRMQIRVLDALGKEYGVEYDVVPTISEGVNAAYAGSGRRIVVALDALDNAYVQAGVHELVHYLKSSDSAAYGVVEEMVVSHLKKDAEFDLEGSIAGRIRAYSQRGQQLSREAAMEEVVAEALPAIFADKESVRELARTNRTLAEKIRDFLVDFVDKIKKIAERYAYDNGRAEVYAMLENREGLVEIARTFDTALRSVDERAGEDNDVPASDAEEVKLSNGKRSKDADDLSKWTPDSRFLWQHLSRLERKAFRDGIDAIHRGDKFPVSADGKYILACGHSLVYTDGDMMDPKVFKVITFNTENGTILDYGMQLVYDLEAEKTDEQELGIILQSVLGEKYVTVRTNEIRTAVRGKNRSTEGRTGASTGEGDRGEVSGPEELKFSLNDSEAFKRWFGDSRIVNPDGTPKVMYHGSAASFTAFDKKKARSSGLYGKGFYFTDSDSHAGTYGKLYQVYLKVENPLTPDGSTVTRAQAKKFLEAVADNEDDYSIENYGTYDVGEVLKKTYQKDAFGFIQDVNATAIGDFVEAVKLFNEVNGTRYDGIIVPTETVVFEPTQIKSATDNVGTFDPENPDIRFSINEQQTAKALEEDWQQVSAGEILVQDLNVDEKAVRRQASEALNKGLRDKLNQQINMAANRIIRDTESRYNRAELRENLGRIAKAYASTGNAALMAQELAEAIIDKSVRKAPSEAAEAYKGVREQLRNAQITLTETQKQEVASEYGSVDAYRKEVFGTVHLRSEGTSLDSLWGELSEKHPEIFPPDTGEAQMPGVLAQFDRMMRPRYENVYGMDAEAAATDLALRIQGDVLGMVGAKGAAQKLYTTADKLRKQIRKEYDAEIRAQQKARVEEFQKIAGQLKEAKEKGDAESRKEIMAKYRAALKKVDAKTAIAEMRAAEKVRNEQRTEAMERARVLNRVQKQANRLRGMLEKPVKGKRVPTFMQESVLKILELLDINSEYSAGKGQETQNAAEWRERLSALRNAYDSIWASQSRGDIPPELDAMMSGLNEKILEDIRRAADALERGEAIRLGSMNSAQLRDVETLLRGVYHTIDSIGKLWRSQRYESVAQLGEASMEQMNSRKEQQLHGALGQARDFFALDMMEPVSYAERLGEGGQEVMQSLLDGQKEKFARMREGAESVQKMLDDTGVKSTDIGKWRRHIHQIRTDDGHVLRLNDVQLMDIDLTARRPQGLQHLLISGMKINTYTKTGPKAVNVQITQADLARMQSLLTDEQKALAERMQQYLAVDVAKWGNDVTQRMYLYDAFGEKTYWPLSSDPNALKTQEPEMDRSLTALTNPGFLKPLVAKANNPLVITDAVERYSRHVAEMASYSGMAEAMTDALGWLNYRRRGENGGIEGSVKGSIERLTGNDGVKYMTALLQDINGARSGGGNVQLSKLLSNYKKAAVAGKIRVALQQPTSIARAMAEINPAYLLSGLVMTRRGTVAEMQKHSALAWWKSNGNYDIGVGKSAEQVIWGETSALHGAMETVTTVGPVLDPGKWDDFAWARIWTAVKQETARLHRGLEKGSDAYWQQVTRRFEEIVDRTQVVDTVMHRSSLMRSKDGMVKSLTSFMAEPVKSYNMLMRAAMEVGRNPKDAKRYVKFCRVAGTFLLSAALTSVATALFDAFKYREDDQSLWEYMTGGGFWKDFTAQWMKGFANSANPVKLVPIVSTVYEMAESKIKGEYSQGATLMSLESVQDTLDACSKIYNYIWDGNTKKLTAYGAFSSGLRAVSEITGLPFAGMLANVEFLTNIYDPTLLSKKADIQSNRDAYQALYNAIASGDKTKENELRGRLAEGLYGGQGKTPKQIDTEVAGILAVSDERIIKAWSMLQKGNQTNQVVKLYKEIQADGFTDEQVNKAVSSVESRMNSRYNDLIEEADELRGEGDRKGAEAKEQEAQALREYLKGYGMEIKETEPKDPNEQLEAKTYSYDNLHAVIRSGSADDVGMIAEVMERESDAQDPAKAIRNAVSGEFRKEYVELVLTDQTAKANDLAKKLAVVGIDEEDLGNWVKDERYDSIKTHVAAGDAHKARAQSEALLDSGVKISSLVSSLNSRFKDEYVELVLTDQTAKANDLAETLQALDLYWKDGKTNYYRQEALDDWVNDSKK